jgi:hypothetical protein
MSVINDAILNAVKIKLDQSRPLYGVAEAVTRDFREFDAANHW